MLLVIVVAPLYLWVTRRMLNELSESPAKATKD